MFSRQTAEVFFFLLQIGSAKVKSLSPTLLSCLWVEIFARKRTHARTAVDAAHTWHFSAPHLKDTFHTGSILDCRSVED